MDINTYYRPTTAIHRTNLEILKSEFVTTITRADTVDDARQFIKQIRDEMPDANHHVYAFIIGYGNTQTEGSSDDGEPSGTAGAPTLAVVRGSGLGDIVVVTTRYFGGKKLGTGGLVKAYTESTQLALLDLPTEVKADRQQFSFVCDYSLYERVKRVLNEYDTQIDDEVFAAKVQLVVTALENDIESLETNLTELSSGQIQFIHL